MFPPMLSPFLDESNELSPPSVSEEADIGTLAVSAAVEGFGFCQGLGLEERFLRLGRVAITEVKIRICLQGFLQSGDLVPGLGNRE